MFCTQKMDNISLCRSTITNYYYFFKNNNLCVTLGTTTTISNFLKTGVPKNNIEYDNSGMYGLSCTTYQLDCIDQKGRSLKPR